MANLPEEEGGKFVRNLRDEGSSRYPSSYASEWRLIVEPSFPNVARRLSSGRGRNVEVDVQSMQPSS